MSVLIPLHVNCTEPQTAAMKLLAKHPELRDHKHILIYDHGRKNFTLLDHTYDADSMTSTVKDTHVFQFAEHVRNSNCFQCFTSDAIASLNNSDEVEATRMTGGMASYNPMSWIFFNSQWFAPYLYWPGFIDEIKIDLKSVKNNKIKQNNAKKHLQDYLNDERHIPVWALQIIDVNKDNTHIRIRYRLNRSLMLRLYQPYLGFVRNPALIPNPLLRDIIRRWCCN